MRAAASYAFAIVEPAKLLSLINDADAKGLLAAEADQKAAEFFRQLASLRLKPTSS